MSLPTFQSLLQIVREVSATPFNQLSNAESVLISVVNGLISEADIALLANQLGIVVTDEFRQIIFEEAVEVLSSIPDIQTRLEISVRLRIIIDRWLSSS